MRECPECFFSFQLGDEHDLRCREPHVNRKSPAFLSGRKKGAKTCFAERQNVVGICGPKGKLFKPKDLNFIPILQEIHGQKP